MPEWTLCADLKVYAGRRAPAKPPHQYPRPPPPDPPPAPRPDPVIKRFASGSARDLTESS